MLFRKVERDDPSKHFYDDPPGQRVLHHNDPDYNTRVKELTEGDFVELADGTYIDHSTAQDIDRGFDAERGSRVLDYRDPQYDQLIGDLEKGDQVRIKDGSLVEAEKAQQSWNNLMDQTEEVKQPMETVVHYTDTQYQANQMKTQATRFLTDQAIEKTVEATTGVDAIGLLKADPTFKEAWDNKYDLAEQAAYELVAKTNNPTIQGYALAYGLNKAIKETDLSRDCVLGEAETRTMEEVGLDSSPLKEISPGIYLDESTMTYIDNREQPQSEEDADLLESKEDETETESDDLSLLNDSKEEEEQKQDTTEELGLLSDSEESEEIQMDSEPDVVESEEVSQEI